MQTRTRLAILINPKHAKMLTELAEFKQESVSSIVRDILGEPLEQRYEAHILKQSQRKGVVVSTQPLVETVSPPSHQLADPTQPERSDER